MTLLIAGLALWYVGHFWKRALPRAHETMGSRAKGVSALLILIGIVFMVIGYRVMESHDLLDYPPALRHVNNLMVLFALYFTSPGPSKGALFYKMRHPMLTGFIIWAVAHIVVNPDLASMILFGALSIWAVLEIIVINRAEPDWQPNPKGTIAKDAMFFVASIVLLAIIGYIHGLIGPTPFGG
ncbi:hypothetical protein ALP8811_02304 [Aliiroseovarius pelagivivens]|uniref:NnrU domain-containing protein n=1 Tax=Aliiroseovarius pelagivivens TaxID=1639690 RepID=A0A2R8AN17_9RHOB|nr:NnrU family protein [Aliiroseovarius pelagivivens]SPF77279.1 hypothetical protein ALP8811_02304 [Aliiroseovarius pelagivivens]